MADLSRDFAWTEAVARRFHEEYERLAPTVAEVFVAERVGEMGHALHCDSKVGHPCDCTLREHVVFRLTAGVDHSGSNRAPSEKP